MLVLKAPFGLHRIVAGLVRLLRLCRKTNELHPQAEGKSGHPVPYYR